MEIVFLILKTVGIILLIILCLFLIAAALLLFVPVRYRAEGRIPEEGKPQASIRFTWLLHLISFRVEYTDGLKMTLRAAGIRIRPERWKRRGKTSKARRPEQSMEEKGADDGPPPEMKKLRRPEKLRRSINLRRPGSLRKPGILPGQREKARTGRRYRKNRPGKEKLRQRKSVQEKCFRP